MKCHHLSYWSDPLGQPAIGGQGGLLLREWCPVAAGVRVCVWGDGLCFVLTTCPQHSAEVLTISVLVNSSGFQEHINPNFCHRSHCLCKSAKGAARPSTPPVFYMCFLKCALWSPASRNRNCRTWMLKGQAGIISSWSQSSPYQLLIYSYSYPFCV